MQIITVGKSYQTRKIAQHLAKNDSNIVFLTSDSEFANNADINPKKPGELEEFICANDVRLCIVADEEYLDFDYDEISKKTECVFLCSGYEFSRLILNLSAAKKFAYKNKFLTSKFNVFEKTSQALDFIQSADFPLVIMPDVPNKTEAPFIAETKKKAKEKIEELFQSGNKKVLIENYIRGIKYTKYLISDGFDILSLGDTVSYFEEISTNNLNYLSKEVREKIEKTIMPRLIDALMEEGVEPKGIFGVEFIIDKTGKIYFEKLNYFGSETDIDIILNEIEEDLSALLFDLASGNLARTRPEIKLGSKYALCANTSGENALGVSNTMKKAIELAIIEGAEEETVIEAIKEWQS